MSRGLIRSGLGLACLLAACGYNPRASTDDARTSNPDATIGDSVLPTDVATRSDTGRDAMPILDGNGRAAEVMAPDASAPTWDDASPTEADTQGADRPPDVDFTPDAPMAPPDTATLPSPDAFIPSPDAPQADAYRPCPVPTLVYAQVEYQAPIVTGTVATYRCNLGYGSQAPVTRKCLDDGTWSGQAPSCNPVDCGQPPPITNGTREFGSTTYLGLARYYCLNDYVMTGGPALTCQADGTWSGPVPTCGRLQYRLTITKTGTGTGTVTGNTVGIACGATCEVMLDAGTPVNLAALADTNQTFIGWESSLCSGRGTCGFGIIANTVIGAYFSPPPNIMFVTSTTQSPAMGGLAQADALCNQRAQAGGLAGTYRAWLSTASASAASRLGAASGWIRPDGKPIFNRLSDLLNNVFFYPPRLDEFGHDQGDSIVMTASDNSGKVSNDANATSCGDFTSTATPPPTFVLGGYASANSEAFTQSISLGCSDPTRIYCLGIDRTALFLPPQPVTGRYAFTSQNVWKPGNGIAAADAVCQTEATQAHLPGTYKALLASNGKSAASRFNTGGPAWIRVDGLPLAASAIDFFSTALLDISPNLPADKSMYYGSSSVWSGASTMTAEGTNATTCFDWLSDVATDQGASGTIANTATRLFFGSWTTGCASYRPVICLQE